MKQDLYFFFIKANTVFPPNMLWSAEFYSNPSCVTSLTGYIMNLRHLTPHREPSSGDTMGQVPADAREGALCANSLTPRCPDARGGWSV